MSCQVFDKNTHPSRGVQAARKDRMDHFDIARIEVLEQRHQPARRDVVDDAERADTTLGDDVRAVTACLGIATQRDPEPERNLLRRADQWPFLEAGIPATAFAFGYRPGSESERIYRQWYRTGYRRPQDDPNQRIDWKAATDFNRFSSLLVTRVADQKAVPTWDAGKQVAARRPLSTVQQAGTVRDGSHAPSPRANPEVSATWRSWRSARKTLPHRRLLRLR